MNDWMKCIYFFLSKIIEDPIRGWLKKSLDCVCYLDLIFVSVDNGYKFPYLWSEKLNTAIWTNNTNLY